MKKRVVILIDGQNLFYNLKEMGIQEKDIKWNLFFQSLLSPDDELSRTYWFRPQKILDNHFDLRRQIMFMKFRGQLSNYRTDKSKVPHAILAQVEIAAIRAEEWLKQKKFIFAQIEYNYDQLCLEFGDIEFVKTGVVKVNPFEERYLGEKGVDISLAVKMITLSVENRCEKIILISGDYDYAEAIKFVKNNMTKIHIVKMHKGIPPKNRSVSRDLAVLADRVIDIFETDLKTTFKK